MDNDRLNRPATWGETLLALGPILLFVLLLAISAILIIFLDETTGPAFMIGLLLVFAGLILVAMTVGWVRNFPRWVFPYWGFTLLVSSYLYSFSGTIFDRPFKGDFRVWIPLGMVALAALLWTRSLHPLFNLVRSIWRDWTLLSFAIYGSLPLLIFAAYEETRDLLLTRIVILLILIAGAVIYMRVESPWHRFASLVGGFSLGWLAIMIDLGLYWNGRQEDWMPAPGSWHETLKWTSRYGLTLMLILVAPVLVEFLRLLISRYPLLLKEPG